MDSLSIFLIANGLAMDAFAVSICVGATNYADDFRPRFRLAFHFGLFQALMTIIGWFAGTTISLIISSVDHWIAFVLLAYVGINMIRSGRNPDGECFEQDPSKGRLLIMLCIATSLDAMAVGLSLAMVDVAIFSPAFAIGVVTLLLSTFGLIAGNRLGRLFGKRMEILGGLILVGIGLKILFEHLHILS